MKLQSPTLNVDTGFLNDARIMSSPRYDERPFPGEISLLVIHGISLPPGDFQGAAIDDFFCNRLDYRAHSYFQQLKNIKVSAHALIRRDGAVTQYVSFLKRAWHAGKSSFNGRKNCNDYSIGIELEGVDDISYTELQYRFLAAITQCLMRHYPLVTTSRIVGHCDIAPGRKSDPGSAFDWNYYQQLLIR